MSHRHSRPEDRRIIQALRGVDVLFARVYHDLDVLTPCRVPRDGPAIVVANHISSLDPVLIQAACPNRLITWLMAREYLDLPGLGWFFKTIGIIPVERTGKDSGPLRAALRELQAGRVLGIFPEGKISPDRNLLPFQTGVAMIAARTGVPVHPVYTDGPHRGRDMLAASLIPTRARLVFGPPYTASSPDHASVVDRIQSSVADLRDVVDNHVKYGHIPDRKTRLGQMG